MIQIALLRYDPFVLTARGEVLRERVAGFQKPERYLFLGFGAIAAVFQERWTHHVEGLSVRPQVVVEVRLKVGPCLVVQNSEVISEAVRDDGAFALVAV